MPVRDLTDQPKQMPRLGKIRLGDRSGTNGAPVNKPYFIVPEEVAAVYGENPTELPIVFLVDDEEVIASSYYRAYNASNGLVCKGDGYQANALLDADVLRKKGGDVTQPLDINIWAHGATRGENVPATKNVTRVEVGCPGGGYEGQQPCPMFALKKCAVRSFFQFAVYGVPGLGVYQMDTGSQINVQRMLGTLEMARTVLGGIAGVPMILRRNSTSVSPTGIRHDVNTVELLIDTKFSLTEVLKLRSGPVANALLPPVDESEVYERPDDDLPALGAGHQEDEDEDSAPYAPEHDQAPGVPMITDAQQAAVADWAEAIGANPNKRTLVAYLDAERRQRWPYAVSGDHDKFESALLSQDDAEGYIGLLRDVQEKGVPEPVGAQAPLV